MDPREAVYRLYIHKVLYNRVLEAQESRQDDIRELLGAVRPDMSVQAAACVAETVPPLLPELHRKWIGLFVDSLLSTADIRQVEVLCDGTDENNAALALAYVMFLESERMEAQMAEDLAAIETLEGVGLADMAATLCTRLTRVEESLMEERRAKAAQYRAAKGSRKTH